MSSQPKRQCEAVDCPGKEVKGKRIGVKRNRTLPPSRTVTPFSSHRGQSVDTFHNPQSHFRLGCQPTTPLRTSPMWPPIGLRENRSICDTCKRTGHRKLCLVQKGTHLIINECLVCLGPWGLSPDSPDFYQMIADAGMHGRVSTGQTDQADLLSEARNCVQTSWMDSWTVQTCKTYTQMLVYSKIPL